MNAWIFCLSSCLAAGVAVAQFPSTANGEDEPKSWRQLIQRWPKEGAALEEAGDSAADAGQYREAASRYESWRDLPGAAPEQKALAMIKLAQLAQAQFEIDEARTLCAKALALAPENGSIAGEIRFRIEDSYRRVGDFPGLVAAWQTYVDAHSDDKEVGRLLTLARRELQHPEIPAAPSKAGNAAVPTLDVHLVESLRAHRRTGRVTEECEALSAAFAAQGDPLLRLEMVESLADAFARSGRLDELVANFRAKVRAESDGWRYAVYLAEIRRNLHDFLGAESELARAFGPRSRDVLYLTECWRVSIDHQSTGERARLARLLAQIDPGLSRETELVTALLRDDETTAALEELRANEAAIFDDPMKWHDVLLQASAAGQGQIVVSLLEAGLTQRAGDWRLRFLLAEARLRTGDFAVAEKLLREVEAATSADASALSAAEDDHGRSENAGTSLFSGVSYGSGAAHGVGAKFARRNGHSFEIRQVMERIAVGLNGISAIPERQFNFTTYEEHQPERSVPQSPAEAADAALVMRSILAQQEGRGAEFVAELREALPKLPRAERIIRLALVQALDPLLEEIVADSSPPSGDEAVDAVCLEALLDLGKGISPVLGGADVEATKLIPLMNVFLLRETHPDTLLLGKMQLSRLWKRAGREKEAGDVAREVLAQWTALPADQRYEIFQFALENGDPEHAEAIYLAMADDQRRAGATFANPVLISDQIRLASAFAAQKAGDTRVAKWLTGAMRDSYDFEFANLSHLSLLRARSAFHQAQEFPYGSRIIGEYRRQTWSEVFGVASQQEQIAALNRAVAEDVRALPPAQGLRARLASICFSWWANEREAAIREALELAASGQDDEVDLLAGSMLADSGRYAEARNLFERISATGGEIASDKIVRLLSLARAEKDVDRAGALALQLTTFPLSSSDRSVLQGILTELDRKGHATEYADKQRAKEQRAYFSGIAAAVQQLQRETRAGNRSAAVGLSRAILARVSPLGNSAMDRYPRRTAIEALGRVKALPDYIGQLETELAADPKSMETLLRLAEASEHADPARSIEYYRRAVESAPADLPLQIRLGNVLAENHRADEAVRVWEAAFAKDPQAIFGTDFSPILSGFKAARELDRLSAVLLNATPQRNPLENLAFGVRDLNICYQEVAAALRDEKKLTEAIELWKASLARARMGKTSAFVESSTLPLLVPALIEAGRQDEAAQELEDYFFPSPPSRPPLGYAVRSVQRNWSQPTFGSGGREEALGIAVMSLAQPAGALDRLRAKAVAAAAAHPQDPERLLVLLIDTLRRDPTRLQDLRKEFDEVIDSALSPDNSGAPKRLEAAGADGAVSLPVPWDPTTGVILRAIAQVLAEWPEGRPLALHVYEKTPDSRAVSPGWIKLRRAEIALSIPDQDAACRALREWLAGSERNPSILMMSFDAEQQLSAVDLMSRAGMAVEAAAVLKKIQDAGEMQSRSDLKKRLEELTSRLKAGNH